MFFYFSNIFLVSFFLDMLLKMPSACLLLPIFAPIAALAAPVITAGNILVSGDARFMIKFDSPELSNGNRLRHEMMREDQTASPVSLRPRRRGRYAPSAATFFTIAFATLAVTYLIFQCFRMLTTKQTTTSSPRRRLAEASHGGDCSKGLVRNFADGYSVAYCQDPTIRR